MPSPTLFLAKHVLPVPIWPTRAGSSQNTMLSVIASRVPQAGAATREARIVSRVAKENMQVPILSVRVLLLRAPDVLPAGTTMKTRILHGNASIVHWATRDTLLQVIFLILIPSRIV